MGADVRPPVAAPGCGVGNSHVVYSLTDPPLKALRRLIPPLRLGGISLDLGFIILFIAVYIACR